MNGSTTGLEPTDASRADNHPVRTRDQIDAFPAETAEQLRILRTAQAILTGKGCWRLERELADEIARWPAGEGQRGSEGVHGEDSPEAA